MTIPLKYASSEFGCRDFNLRLLNNNIWKNSAIFIPFISQIYPEWNMKDYMLVTTVHNMFRYESDYSNNRPMTHYVEQPQEIDSVFDNVSYSKGM